MLCYLESQVGKPGLHLVSVMSTNFDATLVNFGCCLQQKKRSQNTNAHTPKIKIVTNVKVPEMCYVHSISVVIGAKNRTSPHSRWISSASTVSSPSYLRICVTTFVLPFL